MSNVIDFFTHDRQPDPAQDEAPLLPPLAMFHQDRKQEGYRIAFLSLVGMAVLVCVVLAVLIPSLAQVILLSGILAMEFARTVREVAIN